MDAIRNIVAIVDPTREEQPAVFKAAQLAERLNVTLELFACDTAASLAARQTNHAARSTQNPFADFRSMLDSIALPLRARGLAMTATIAPIADNLPTTILKHVDTTADLIVKDTHHHSIARRTFLSNTDWQLIRHCRLPLLLTKSRPWSASPCVVAAVDPGHVNDKSATLDRRILDYGSFIAKTLGGWLHVAHAYLPETVIAQAIAGEPPMVDVLASESLKLEEQSKRALVSSLLSDYRVAPRNLHVQIGSAIEYLVHLADSLPADIVTMGAIARSGINRIFIGSTAEGILERLPCDALIVKTPDFASSLPF